MTIEERLKQLILERYGSVSEFTRRIGIPRTTIASVFERGIANSSISTIVKISKSLGISADALAENQIVFVDVVRRLETIELEDVLTRVKNQISHADNVTIDGEPVGEAMREVVVKTLDMPLEIAKKYSK